MKPASLLGVSLDLIAELVAPGKYPADARVGRFFRSRRFLGSRDRRTVGELAYTWLRHGLRARGRSSAWIATTGHPAVERDPTTDGIEMESFALELRWSHLFDFLALAADGLLPWTLDETLHAAIDLAETTPPPGDWKLLFEEAQRGDFLRDTPWPEDPLDRFATEVSLPHWVAERLVNERGEETAKQLATALLEPARVDLRVNLSKQEREAVRTKLANETKVGAELTHFSPLGISLEKRTNLTATTASQKGWVEIQDEGSQLAVLCCDIEAGQVVIDACAGGGGKTLAIVDLILKAERERVDGGSKGRIWALDVEDRKLQELARRAGEAGVENRIRLGLIGPGKDLPSVLPEADLVLIDAPCSGLGTLRRNPELKRLYNEASIQRFAEQQSAILDRFAPTVARGGKLAYVTCSLLAEECEDVARRFEETHTNFVPAESEWAKTRLPSECIDGHFIRLDPVTTKTDGFFIATWKRT